MHEARELARMVRRQCCVRGVPTEGDLERIADAAGLRVYRDDRRLMPPVQAVVSGEAVGLARGLDPDRRRWLLACCLGHAALSCEPLVFTGQRIGDAWREQRNSELFAGWLFWLPFLGDEVSARDLAEFGGVPVACASGFLADLLDLTAVALPAPSAPVAK
jgi:hypothetical protein